MARFAALRERYRGRPTVAVFYEIWPEPLMSVNGRHLISQLVEICGGRNVFAAAGPLVPTISREQLARRRSGRDRRRGARTASRRSAGRTGSRGASLRAAREGRVYGSDPAVAHRMGPRIVDGGVELCETLDRARRAPR